MSFQSDTQREAFNELVSATRWDVVNTLRNSEYDFTICGLAERTQRPEICVRNSLTSLVNKGSVTKYKFEKATYYKWNGNE